MRIQFYLTRHIDDNEILLRQRIQSFGDEVEVLEQEFEAVYQTTVRAETHLFHNIFKGDQFLDVEIGLMGKFFGRGVEIDVEAGAAVVAEVGYEGGAEGSLERFRLHLSRLREDAYLACTGRAHNQDTKFTHSYGDGICPSGFGLAAFRGGTGNVALEEALMNLFST